MSNKIRYLKANEIEVKVKQISEKGCLLLLYKTARVDMDILDETFGSENWESDYKEIKGNLYCGIGIQYDGNWVWKWDCGIESKEDNEGNQKKGEASDAFKRAGFKVGIGRELYTSPFIWANEVETSKNAAGFWNLKNPFQKFEVKEISYDSNGEIENLVIVDKKTGKEVWSNKKCQTPRNEAPKKSATDELQERIKYVADQIEKSKTLGFLKILVSEYQDAFKADSELIRLKDAKKAELEQIEKFKNETGAVVVDDEIPSKFYGD